jgi:hypothetical protein
MIHRKAKPDDIDAIVDLAMESVSINPLPVTADPVAMREMAMQCLNPAHFMWVTEKDGKIVAAVAALTQRLFWARGLQVSVLLHYSRLTGAWVALMRKLAQWMKARHGIKLGIIELEPGTKERVIEFLQRLGFARPSTNLCFVRGA